MLRKLIVIMVGLALLGGFAAMEAQAKGKQLVLRVKVDGGTFDPTINEATALAGAAFYVSGAICEDPELGASCDPIGTFHCWGWMVDSSPMSGAPVLVSQEFDLFGRGKIQTQGVEDEGPRAVVGGTGDFRNVRGEATGFDFSRLGDLGEFTGTFELIGAKRKKKDDD